MSLPPALLARLAQRGLVQKSADSAPAENEEVIAEDYDEDDGDTEEHGPEAYEEKRSKREDNFWLERMKLRMGEATEIGGYKGCPNKYNIWHKCTLFCVKRWGDGIAEPSREYMRRYKRLRRKYPLPKGWTEMYDAGCGCFYFYCATDNVVSWLPPTHPKSQVGRTAAYLRRQLEENAGEGAAGGGGGSDGERSSDDDDENDDNDEEKRETRETRHQREIDEIINSSLRPRSPPTQQVKQTTLPMLPQDFPSLQESVSANSTSSVVSTSATLPSRKPKNRDLDRSMSRQRRDRYGRHGRGGGDEPLDPMDPSAYSDTPRGKWSDGLHAGEERSSKKSSAANETDARDRRRDMRSDDDNDNDVDDDGDDDDDEGR